MDHQNLLRRDVIIPEDLRFHALGDRHDPIGEVSQEAIDPFPMSLSSLIDVVKGWYDDGSSCQQGGKPPIKAGLILMGTEDMNASLFEDAANLKD
jgi:hypothetical protein